MAELRSAVYTASPALATRSPSFFAEPSWSPISCTLVYSSKEAVLVDTPLTIKQTEDMIEWIKKVAPHQKLSYIYITHGHGDHFFGLPLLLKSFPEAVPIATKGTVAHMQDSIAEPHFTEFWGKRFPDGQIARPFVLAKPLEGLEPTFKLEDRWEFQVVDCGHSDTYSTTALWVPDLKLAVCGDVVYGQVHQMLFFANTKAKRDEWIRAIEKIEALGPHYVVPGHRQPEEIDGAWHLAATRKYIEDFGRVLEGDPKDADELFGTMMSLYPERYNPNALKQSAMGAFMVARDERI